VEKLVWAFGNGTYQDLAGNTYPLNQWVFNWDANSRTFLPDKWTLKFNEAWDRAGREIEARKQQKQKDEGQNPN
jgi:hypothetical protein